MSSEPLAPPARWRGMSPRLRKLVLTAHVTFSVGWLGAVAAFLALAISGLTSDDARVVCAAYLAVDTIGTYVIVPFGVGSLVAGLVQSLGTEWGLLRYYWVLVKFVLTVGAIALLLLHMQLVRYLAGVAASTSLSSSDLSDLRIQLVGDAGAALLVLLVATALSIFKPRGMTRRGRRARRVQASA
jgi:hypothetical protein